MLMLLLSVFGMAGNAAVFPTFTATSDQWGFSCGNGRFTQSPDSIVATAQQWNVWEPYYKLPFQLSSAVTQLVVKGKNFRQDEYTQLNKFNGQQIAAHGEVNADGTEVVYDMTEIFAADATLVDDYGYYTISGGGNGRYYLAFYFPATSTEIEAGTGPIITDVYFVGARTMREDLRYIIDLLSGEIDANPSAQGIDDLQAAIDAAKAVYRDASASDADCQAQIALLKKAKAAFQEANMLKQYIGLTADEWGIACGSARWGTNPDSIVATNQQWGVFETFFKKTFRIPTDTKLLVVKGKGFHAHNNTRLDKFNNRTNCGVTGTVNDEGTSITFDVAALLADPATNLIDEDGYYTVSSENQRTIFSIFYSLTADQVEAGDVPIITEMYWGIERTIRQELAFHIRRMTTLWRTYRFSDKAGMLEEAIATAQAVHDNAAATDADCEAQMQAMADAEQEFLLAIDFDTDSKMNKFYSLNGMALGLSSRTTTVGSYTGRALELVSVENATNFLLQKQVSTEAYNLWTLKTAAGTIVQAEDGTLMLVDATQLTTTNAAPLRLTNMGTADEPGYTFAVKGQYYYWDNEEGLFGSTEELPIVESGIDEMADYLFFPMPADEYDPTDHNERNYPMTAGEGSLFEFNGETEYHVEPAYAYSFDTYQWDAAAKAAATERATLPYAEGWSVNGWNLRTNVSIEHNVAGTAVSAMRLSVKTERDDIHADTLSTSIQITDFTNGQSVSVMREHGRYTSATNRVPVMLRADGSYEQQVPDSLYAINLNSGINRYFAIKWKATNDNITFGGMTFYVRKYVEEPAVSTANLLERRGDVYVWDLLDAGIPYGDRKACAQYLSWNGLSNAQDAVYVDWMRFYQSLDEVPTESMQVPSVNGIESIEHSTLNIEHSVYDLQGRRMESSMFNIQSSMLKKGIYIIGGKKYVK